MCEVIGTCDRTIMAGEGEHIEIERRPMKLKRFDITSLKPGEVVKIVGRRNTGMNNLPLEKYNEQPNILPHENGNKNHVTYIESPEE
jgi:hypothetical protein